MVRSGRDPSSPSKTSFYAATGIIAPAPTAASEALSAAAMLPRRERCLLQETEHEVRPKKANVLNLLQYAVSAIILLARPANPVAQYHRNLDRDRRNGQGARTWMRYWPLFRFTAPH